MQSSVFCPLQLYCTLGDAKFLCVDQGLLFQDTRWLRPRFTLSSSLGGWGTSQGALIENGLPGVGLYLG
jgi:hypothetical protein